MTFARTLSLCFLATLACRQSPAGVLLAPIPPGPVGDQLQSVLVRDSARFVEFRRDLHRHPEVSGSEQRTAAVVATAMRQLGLEVRTGVGGHGVVAILRGGRSGPVIAYRADMDAVPSAAPDPVDFRSLTPGIRHICGHDLHTTIGLAVATMMRQVRDSLTGTVVFVFQPAEERATGANAMLADNVFASPTPTAIYGLHTAPYEVGRIATTPGPMMAGRDRFEVTISGAGDLSAAADAVAARLLTLGTIGPEQVTISQPPDFVLLQVTSRNVSGTQARLQGEVRVASAASRARTRTAITQGLSSAVAAGITVAGTYEPMTIAGVTNDTVLADRAAEAAGVALGASNVARVTTIPPAFSEDFGSFQARIPGVFFYLGVSNASRGWVGQPHAPEYVADERAIQVGARAMAAVLLDALSR
ncbi:MAG: amidohydrolase [Cytophagaceae bacterium]|nr:amidohydrolase [Gemmatimonadaceae bacterium]